MSMREELKLLQQKRSESGPMIVNHVCRCLLPFLVVGIVACEKDKPPPAGPDLTLPALVVLAPDSLRLLVDQTGRVGIVVLNAVGDTLTTHLSFSSEDTTVATVDSTGLVRARAGGVVYVDVAAGDIHALLLVRVRVNGTLVVSPHLGLVTADWPLQLTVEVRDSTGALVPNAIVQYRSGDTSIARVSSSGTVTFNRFGNVTIIANSEGRIDGVVVTAVLARFYPGSDVVASNAAGDVVIGADPVTVLRPPSVTPIGTVSAVNVGVFYDVALNSNATRAYVADGSFGKVVGLDIPGNSQLFGQQVGFPTYQPYGPDAIALDPGDSVVYYAANGYVNRLNVATMDTSRLFQSGGVHRVLIRDPWMYVMGVDSVLQYNIRTRTMGKRLLSPRFNTDIALSPDATRLYVVKEYSPLRIRVWDVTTGDTLPAIDVPGGSKGYAAVQPTTGLLWVSSPSVRRVFVVDPVTRTIVRTFQPGGQPGRIVFTPSGIGVLGNGNLYGSGGWVDFVR